MGTGKPCRLAWGTVQGPWEACGAVGSPETLQPMWYVTRKASNCFSRSLGPGSCLSSCGPSLAVGLSFSGAPAVLLS